MDPRLLDVVDGSCSRRCIIPSCQAILKPPRTSLKNQVYESLIAGQFYRKDVPASSPRQLPVICKPCYIRKEGSHADQVRSEGLFVLVYIASDSDRCQLKLELESRGNFCDLQNVMPFSMEEPDAWWCENSFIVASPLCVAFCQFSNFCDATFSIQPS
jgi:hypothetical protein